MAPTENCWPDEQLLLLLQAALLPTHQASIAWNKFLNRVDLETAEHLVSTFLPMVYYNIKSAESASLQKCISVYRHTWSSNQLQLHKLKQLLKQFHAASIPTTILKGAAMALHYYPDPGLRVFGDIDLLVSRSQAKAAIQLLRSLGWYTKTEDAAPDKIDHFIQRSHALMLYHPKAFHLDLHWTILSESGIDPLLAGYSPRTLQIAPHHTILCPEDQLLHTLFHGLKYSPVPLIRWIPDASTILQKTPHFGWDYFHSQAKQLRIQHLIYTSLSFLRTHCLAPVPQLPSYTPLKKELAHLKFLTQKPNRFFSIYQLYWHTHARNSPLNNCLALAATMPRFLKTAQKITHWNQLFLFFFRGAFQHFKKALVNS